MASLHTKSYRQHRNAAIVTLALTQGLRAIEIRRLNWEDVSYRQIWVLGKGRTVKVSVPLTEVAAAQLGSFRKRHNRQLGAIFQSVAHNSLGKRLSTRSIRGMCRDALGEAGWPSLDAHSLRHSFACIALSQGLGVADIQRLLRHKDIRTTYRYLRHANIDQQYADKISEVFR